MVDKRKMAKVMPKRVVPRLAPIGMIGREPLILPNHSGDNFKGFVSKTPTKDVDIANKKYVDDVSGNYVLKAGDTMSGDLTITNSNLAPTLNLSTLGHDWEIINIAGGSLYFQFDGGTKFILSNTGFLTLSNGLSVAGNITLTGTVDGVDIAGDVMLNNGDTASGNYNFDSNTFVVDSVNHRVGVGTASPSRTLEVNGSFEVDNTPTAFIARFLGGTSAYLDIGTSAIVIRHQIISTTAYIGTPTAHTLAFKTNSLPAMYITAAQKVGIGTNSPDADLEVEGATGIRCTRDGVPAQYIELVTNSSGHMIRSEGNKPWYFDASGGVGDFNFGVGTAAADITMTIDTGNKRLGVGTLTPDTKLQVVGDCKFGDDNTNYLSVATDGELSLTGTARVKKVDWIGAEGIKAPQANPATFVEQGIKGSWQFANAIEANQESVSGTWKIPNGMDATVAPTFNIGWSANGISPGNCRWKFEYLWVGANEDVTGAAQESIEVTSVASATSNGLVVVSISGIDLPSGTDKAMFWRVTRESGDALDTIAGTTEMHGNFMEFTVDKLGTPL